MTYTADLKHLSILSNFSKAQIFAEPYPYLVIKDALQADLYADLEGSFPSEDLVIDGREKRDTWYINFCGDITRDLFRLNRPPRLALKHKLQETPVL